ncbi:hypothetical protein O6H91_06G127000 [Diphasiastrum complanatum]|uniref:Uncharacterized protein n=2 Tax=Diphasiastrum complanatum TaxID=34168 RepID=A0ACC2DJ02_DIPCM|nr:hypothetical protein O6H91_06G126300 [Diphasiastrum complanatum]KAJ7554132.1 hypothetical protein O6H91_06G127000 [Diphasiastrum complanatum]
MTKPRVLVVGGTGRLGQYISKASLEQGYPTFLLTRSPLGTDESKTALIQSFKDSGAIIVEGSLENYESLLSALRQVDVVISPVTESKLLDQLKLVEAIKEVGTIKRFLPSEFGTDPDKVLHALEPSQKLLFGIKRQVRRAIEEAGIPYTYISSNCIACFFVSGLAQYGQFTPPRDKVAIYGDGNTKVVWVDEHDSATYTLKTIDDPRTINKTVYLRPPANILSQNEVVEIWEKKIGKTLERTTISEEDILKRIQDEGFPVNVDLATFHVIFYKGALYGFDMGPNGLDSFELYPEVTYTTVDSYLDRFL